jgi:uncharacterized OB-fold protein
MTTAPPERPLPRLPEPDSAEKVIRSAAHELIYYRCPTCEQVTAYGRTVCTNCSGPEMVATVASGEGTVYSCTLVRRAAHPFFSARAPYCVAIIELDEGPHLMSELVGVGDCDVVALVGKRVRVRWEDHAEVSIPLFTLA